jgi:hypothetical protein
MRLDEKQDGTKDVDSAKLKESMLEKSLVSELGGEWAEEWGENSVFLTAMVKGVSLVLMWDEWRDVGLAAE